MNILVIGARSPLSLYLVKSLKNQNYSVILADYLNLTIARFSKYIKKYEKLFPPNSCKNKFEESLCLCVEKHEVKKIVVINEDILHVSKLKKKLNEMGVVLDIMEFEKLKMLHNKESFSKLAQKNGLIVPKTTIYTGEKIDLNEYIVKPVYSRFGNEKKYAKTNPLLRSIKQEKVIGEQIAVYTYSKQGSVFHYLAYRTNLGLDNQTGFIFEKISNLKLEFQVSGFIEKVNINGPCSFDFIFDGNNFYCIECNPRFTHGAALLGEEIGYFDKKLSFNNCANVLGFKILWILKIFKEKKWRKSYNQLIKSKDYLFDKKDIKPFLFSGLILVIYIFYSLIKGVSVNDFLTKDILYEEMDV